MTDVGALREQLSATGRNAVRARQWQTADDCGRELLRHGGDDAEGYFLLGLAAKGRQDTGLAMHELARASALDRRRYDAAVELAGLYQALGAHGEAVYRLQACEHELQGSPYYLDMAATIYARAGLPGPAWRLYRQADRLQPGVDSLRAKLAAACVHVGRRDEACAIYRELLAKNPRHQRNHYELSRLVTARDRAHIEQMLAVLKDASPAAKDNIYLYYALGKEHEDLGEWDAAFGYFRQAGHAAASVARYDVEEDLRIIDAVMARATPAWLAGDTASAAASSPTPLFIVGLPRSGTTLVERILSAHSQVGSAGESFFVAAALTDLGGGRHGRLPDGPVLQRAADTPGNALAERYLAAIAYRLGAEPLFIDKLPENYLYAGYLARAFPDATFVHVRRHPLDACLALFKQSYFRYAYTLDDLARYYPAYHRLVMHWRSTLGRRFIDVDYENLVADPATIIPQLLERLGLAPEPACLAPEANPAATNSASAAQVRERIHTRSVGRWRHFERHLAPLAGALWRAGIDVGR